MRKIQVETQNAAISIRRAKDRLETAVAEVALAKQMVQAEQQKFRNGASSLLQVNLRERFYADALNRLIEAQADWARAEIALQWVIGII